ncbi:hypothetical protein [Paenibacillus endoradicis]|uniref:hypothetical protein n=1 Tax=Paenibacillus endoradicis TaxID=2972487 RepID=UPI0021599162|nr:hypothetical protein [Paenibacillus endoradicis]MCR8659169.1 hypothetical protein [Paenibacillus endoradicis]
MSYRFQVKRTVNNKEDVNIREGVCICVIDTETGFFKVHPISRFILDEFPNSFNSQKSAAEEIKKFLNWTYIDNYEGIKISSLSELRIEHGVIYLNELKRKKVKGNETISRSSLKIANRYLTRFYYYLSKMKLLDEIIKPNYHHNANGRLYFVSPFIGNGFSLPHKNNLISSNKLKAFPTDSLITYFIEVSRKVAPDITLGIYFQFFGGLRKGEIVNLTRSSLILKGLYGKDGLEVIIKDNTSLFSQYKDAAKNQVKKPRSQIIQRLPYLREIIEYHYKYILNNAKNNEIALFINSKGKPMTGAVYEKRFNKVKKNFLKLLEGSQYYTLLARTSWSTHIGRGIYTNLMAKLVSSPQELAILRDDAGLDTAIGYMSQHRIQIEIEAGLENMWENGDFKYE